MKEIFVIRHGELENPRGMVYNRDVVMRVEDIIHLSEKGRAQFPLLAQEIKRHNKVPAVLWCSPETRARESAEILRREMCLSSVTIVHDLDEVCAPGPYLEGMTMTEFEQQQVDVYGRDRWGKYQHETAQALTERMVKVVMQMVAKLEEGQVGAMVSHGDPIAFLFNYLQNNKIPDPGKVRSMMYPLKGSATLLTYSNEGEFVKLEPFGDPILRRK